MHDSRPWYDVEERPGKGIFYRGLRLDDADSEQLSGVSLTAVRYRMTAHGITLNEAFNLPPLGMRSNMKRETVLKWVRNYRKWRKKAAHEVAPKTEIFKAEPEAVVVPVPPTLPVLTARQIDLRVIAATPDELTDLTARVDKLQATMDEILDHLTRRDS
jgi:hypothetical protein